MVLLAASFLHSSWWLRAFLILFLSSFLPFFHSSWRNMENLSSHDTKNTKSRRGRKGATQLTKLVQIRGGKKIHIDLDERGEPIDRGKGNLFKSFVGLTARQKISILENEWDDVKESDRDEVWNTILFTYDIPDNKFLKKKWLSYAGGMEGLQVKTYKKVRVFTG
ncbi:uncharacterized protein LOC129290710 [Prosopis cineraria]|uniref:uncharacterized protein LOC129290710 n=1 Tax=Prosopis cineraria TaxID=364024 RepID=UPI00240F72DB|nr:uncharacterized protein LOC129290710 [Prosopis cineraria]